MKKSLRLLLVFPVILLLISCDSRIVFEKNSPIATGTWNFKDSIHYDINISDTVRAYNVYINIRNSPDYQYNNIFLFLSVFAPNGNLLKDTFEIPLAGENGMWYGKGVGGIFSIQAPYKMNIKFPFRGIYMFDIQHAMWNEDLQGVTDVGIRIEEHK